MLNSRNFKKIYYQLQDIDSQATAIHSILESLPFSLEFFHYELENESNTEVKNKLTEVYNHLILDKYPVVLQSFLRKDVLSLQTIFGHLSAFVFEHRPFETACKLDLFTNQLIQRINKRVIDNGSPEEILREINYKITQSLIIDSSFIGHYDFYEVPRQHIVSQYTLGILILIIAEKLHLPIFGLPFIDKIVLCYTENYCTHSELVTENDILYYVVLGEKDITYTLEDLKLLAIIQEETLDFKAVLPQSTQRIVELWLEHLSQGNFDAKTKFNLSSIYQQIFSLAEEF